MKWLALKTSVGLSVLFLVVYGSCNVFTSYRSDVGAIVFGWERFIPFVPLMIVPYLSIDLFFFGAAFLCRDKSQLRIVARRIALAILVAGVFFLAMPLRFTFDRPHADGVLGGVFDRFRSLDKPFNQFPSLHITLAILVMEVYIRRTRGGLHLLVQVWFSLIAASTLLVYQHHFIDVVGGLFLAVFCIYAIPAEALQLPVTPNRKIGTYYFVGTAILIALAIYLKPWGLLLLWPAMSTGIVAAGSFGAGPGIYRKHKGRLMPGARLLMLPVLLGQWLSWRHYAKQSDRWNTVTDRVWLGRLLTPAEADLAIGQGVTAVLDLTCEFSVPPSFKNVRYMNMPILDLTAPTTDHLTAAMKFIDDGVHDGIVYVYCKAGYSRSGAVAATYLLHSGRAKTADDAIKMLRRARPRIVLRGETLRAIRAFGEARTALPIHNAPSISILSDSE